MPLPRTALRPGSGPGTVSSPARKVAPSSGAPTSPVTRRGENLVSRCSTGTNPTNVSPIAMVTAPPSRCSRSWLTASAPISPNTDAVPATNTAVNPPTNSSAAPAARTRRPAPLIRVVAAEAGEIGQVSGNQRHTARRGERHRSRQRRGTQPEHQRPRCGRLLERGPDSCSIDAHCSRANRCNTGSMSPADTARRKTAATR